MPPQRLPRGWRPQWLAAAMAGASMAGATAVQGTTFGFIKAMTMTKLQTSMVGLVVAAGLLAPLVIQQQRLDGLMQEHSRLQSQAEHAAQLRADQKRLADQRTAAEPALPRDEYLRLIRLRGEVGVQQRQLEKLKSELAARENSATARAMRSPITTNYFPKSAWATAGSATPEAALQSMTWLLNQPMSHKDLPVLLAGAGPAMRAAAEKSFAGKSDAEIDAELAQDGAHFTNIIGMRVINKQIVSPDQIAFTFYIDGMDGFGRLPLQRAGGIWQLGDFPLDP